MSYDFVIIKMCYVHNQWHDISCATLYFAPIQTTSTCKSLTKFDLCFTCYFISVSPAKNLAQNKGIANIYLTQTAQLEYMKWSHHYHRHRCTIYKQTKCKGGNSIITDIYTQHMQTDNMHGKVTAL